MHLSSYQHMEDLATRYLKKDNSKISILDIGSYDVNGSYKPIFKDCNYFGVDLLAGPNVDVVLESPYKFPFSSNKFDLVISGQSFEHIEFFWLTWMEMLRVAKRGGLLFLIAPSRGPEHRYPQDCWRFYPDGFKALAKYGHCDLMEVTTDWDMHFDPGSNEWGDTVGVFKKLKTSSLINRIKNNLISS